MERVTAYHGTSKKFSKFDYDKIGSVNGTDSGFGFYFTSEQGEALMYGDIVMEVELRLKRKCSSTDKTFTRSFVENKFLPELKRAYNADYVMQHFDGDTKTAIDLLYDSSETDVDIIGELVNSMFGGNPEKVLKSISKLGYNYTEEKKSLVDSNNAIHYVMFDNNDIKILKSQNI